ncbi:MAG: hypothetical protein JJT89_16925 [Nitriliruptoraceae bacterium]|nr:hypothetical protein [Nitriliruptoraceae bacterium]
MFDLPPRLAQLTREERRLVDRAVEAGARIGDPRLAAATIERARQQRRAAARFILLIPASAALVGAAVSLAMLDGIHGPLIGVAALAALPVGILVGGVQVRSAHRAAAHNRALLLEVDGAAPGRVGRRWVRVLAGMIPAAVGGLLVTALIVHAIAWFAAEDVAAGGPWTVLVLLATSSAAIWYALIRVRAPRRRDR